jgi:hypothetical protein
MRGASNQREISNRNLLIGLAECRHEMLAREGITADEIRELLRMEWSVWHPRPKGPECTSGRAAASN